jgi:hypothetical protein
MPETAPGLFGPGIDLLLAPDWENLGLGAAMETVWTILRNARLENVQAPIPISNPNNLPILEIGGQPPADTPFILVINKKGIPPTEPASYPLPLGAPGGKGATPISSRLVTIKKVQLDTLVVFDPADPDFQNILVAKPFVLQSLAPAYDPVTDYSVTDGNSAQARTANLKSGDSEDQVVLPIYQPGDRIYILNLPVPVVVVGSSELTLYLPVTWVDLNVDARVWAVHIPTENQTP